MKEDEIHIQIVEYWELCKPFGAFVHHSPNESWKAKVAWRMKQKRMGVRHGFPDLLFFLPDARMEMGESLRASLARSKDAEGAHQREPAAVPGRAERRRLPCGDRPIVKGRGRRVAPIYGDERCPHLNSITQTRL